jgi:glycosyltransferase involved in cell wall biosynthesis
MKSKVIYSICMINLNMAETIRQSVSSIARQIDSRFEIVILDGGSTDKSLEIINELTKEFPMIVCNTQKYDKKNTKGLDRNKSVDDSKGEYVLLHLDCDDIYDNFILDWVYCFHLIEKEAKKDVLVSGKHINMIKKTLFKTLGGYRDLDFEDRDLWMRVASKNRLILWDHIDFVERLPKNFKHGLKNRTKFLYLAVENDYLQGLNLDKLAKHYLIWLLSAPSFDRLLRFSLTFIVCFLCRNKPKLNIEHNFDPITFSHYKKNHTKKLCEIIKLDKNLISSGFINSKSNQQFLN